MMEYKWKDTVRAIYDDLHFGEYTAFQDKCARHIIELIERRHCDYFLKPHKDEK